MLVPDTKDAVAIPNAITCVRIPFKTKSPGVFRKPFEIYKPIIGK